MNNEFEDIQDPPGGGDMGNAFLVAREVGERNHNPHGQGALAVSTTKALLTAAVRDAIDGAIAAHAHAQAITCVCILKVCAEADWVRLIGYCMKDQGLAHFLSVHGGLSAEFMNNAAQTRTPLRPPVRPSRPTRRTFSALRSKHAAKFCSTIATSFGRETLSSHAIIVWRACASTPRLQWWSHLGCASCRWCGVCPRVRVSAFPRVRVSTCPCVRVSACPHVRVSCVCPRVRVSVCLGQTRRWDVCESGLTSIMTYCET